MAIKWITSKQPVIFNSRHQRYHRPAVVELKIDYLCGSHGNDSHTKPFVWLCPLKLKEYLPHVQTTKVNDAFVITINGLNSLVFS